MSERIAAVILAAGQSKRMGQPKMLLPWGTTTVLGRVVGSFAEAGIEEIVVVTGAEQSGVAALVSELGQRYAVRSIHNPEYATGGMVSSMQCGLAALAERGASIGAALIGLGDQPQMATATVRAITALRLSSGAALIVPSHGGRRGHPWLLGRRFWTEIGAMRAPETARDFLNRHADDIRYVNVDTPSIHEDLDTPEQYLRLRHD
jgi:molybdenum cofactor cytidylyltransferase